MIFSITKAYTVLTFRLLSLHTLLEGTVSQIFYFGPSFYFMTKIGKHFINFVKMISNSHKIKTKALKTNLRHGFLHHYAKNNHRKFE